MRFLLLKSEFKLDHQVILFDVGHGDCLLLLDRDRRGLLVDCGSINPKLHIEVPKSIETILRKNNQCGFIISHYHFDHYSLFHWLIHPEFLFSKIYVPALPIRGPGRDAARAIKYYISAAVLVDYSYYRILPEIFGRAKRPLVPRKKGDCIKEASQNLRVLWPDILHPILGTDEIRKKARQIIELIELSLTHSDFKFPLFEAGDSLLGFFENLEYLRDQELSNKRKNMIQRVLSKVEGSFRNLADLFSLVANSYRKRHSRFLFLGDVRYSILNRIAIPGKRHYSCIKAAHHGTRFGKALADLSTEFLLISRNKKELSGINIIHSGYLCDIDYRMILSTEFLRHCHII